MFDNKDLDDAIEKQSIINQQARNDKKIAKITGIQQLETTYGQRPRQLSGWMAQLNVSVGSCGKMAFASAGDVKAFIKLCKRRKGRKSLHKCSPYLCPKCGAFHLTSQKGKVATGRKKALARNLKLKGE